MYSRRAASVRGTVIVVGRSTRSLDCMSEQSDCLGIEDRLIAAGISAIAAGATIVIAAIALTYALPDGVTFMTALAAVPIWATGTAIAAAIAGYALGTRRIVEAFGHLWFTSNPERPWITLLMWSVVAAIGIIAYVATAHAI